MAKRKRKSTGPNDAALRRHAFGWWLFDLGTFVALPLFLAVRFGGDQVAEFPGVDRPFDVWQVVGAYAVALYVVRRLAFRIEYALAAARDAAADAAAKAAAAARSTGRPGRSLRGRGA